MAAFQPHVAADDKAPQRADNGDGGKQGEGGGEQLQRFGKRLRGDQRGEKGSKRQAVGGARAQVEAGGGEVQLGGFAAFPLAAVGQGDAAVAEEAAKPRAVAAAVALGAAAAFADVVHRHEVEGGGVSSGDADADGVVSHGIVVDCAEIFRRRLPKWQAPAGIPSEK